MYTSLTANDFFVTVVTNNHFERGAYVDRTISSLDSFKSVSRNNTSLKDYGDIGYQSDSPAIQQFIRVLEGNNTSIESYKDLILSECTKVYNTDFLSNHRNLFLITNHNSNTTYNNTLLGMFSIDHSMPSSSRCMCPFEPISSIAPKCDPSQPSSNLTRGLPWQVDLKTFVTGVVEIAGCKSEITEEKCKVQFSLDTMIVVIFCNLVKACCMIVVLVRARESTLVTLGDAIDSFLRIPDTATIGMCFADRSLINREWRHRRTTGPRQWKQKGVQRWWTSVSKVRWIAYNFFCSINIILLALLLVHGMKVDGKVWSTDFRSM